MNERRGQGRARTYLGGIVTFNHGRQHLDCLVRNLSASGARFDFSDGVMLPDTVALTIPQRCETRRVRIVWRRNDTVGVAFLPPAPGHNVVPFGRPRGV